MTEISNKKKREIAELLYIQNDMSQQQIADEMSVSQKTISAWKAKFKWDELKAAHNSGTSELIKNLLMANLEMTRDAKKENRRLTAKETDSIIKNAKTVKLLSKDVNVVSTIMVFKHYNKWLVDQSPDLAKANTEFQRKYLYQLNSDE